MKLYGRYLSPFVRRVAISLNWLGLPFEHLPLSVIDQRDALRKVNPLVRVPALELDDGGLLIDSAAILDAIDHMVEPARALVPRDDCAARAEVLNLVALAMGACEKTVSAYYERTRRPAAFCYEPWASQCEEQARDGLAELDRRLAAAGGGGQPVGAPLVAGRLTQAEVSAVTAWDFTHTVLPESVTPLGAYPHLEALAAHWNAHPAFKATHPKPG